MTMKRIMKRCSLMKQFSEEQGFVQKREQNGQKFIMTHTHTKVNTYPRSRIFQYFCGYFSSIIIFLSIQMPTTLPRAAGRETKYVSPFIVIHTAFLMGGCVCFRGNSIIQSLILNQLVFFISGKGQDGVIHPDVEDQVRSDKFID